MKMLKNTSALALIVTASVLIVGCSSAEPTDDPGVDRMGQYILMSKGPEAEAVIGYRHAQNQLGSEWLMLEVAMTSPPGQTARIERKNISVRTPAGVTIPMATQNDFIQDFGSLQSFISAANVVRDPMDYWPPRKQTCPLEFFVEPGRGISYDQVTVNDFRACQGRFWFKVPGGVQAGRYVLTIELEESEIRIPFTFES
jgi:hypothetical protein